MFAGHRLRYKANMEDPRDADTLSVMIIDDDVPEMPETFEIFLVEVQKNAYVVKPIGTITIEDDDERTYSL